MIDLISCLEQMRVWFSADKVLSAKVQLNRTEIIAVGPLRRPETPEVAAQVTENIRTAAESTNEENTLVIQDFVLPSYEMTESGENTETSATRNTEASTAATVTGEIGINTENNGENISEDEQVSNIMNEVRREVHRNREALPTQPSAIRMQLRKPLFRNGEKRQKAEDFFKGLCQELNISNDDS